MNEKTRQQVGHDCVALFQNGEAAMARNEPGAAIPDFLLALEVEPGFFECRAALRRAALAAAASPSSVWKRFRNFLRSFCLLSKVQLLLPVKPVKAVAVAERLVTENPYNFPAHKLLAKAALASGLPHAAMLSLETLPAQDRRTNLEMAEALVQCGRFSEATALYGRLLKEYPNDPEFSRALSRRHGPTAAAASPASARMRRTSAAPIDEDDGATIEHYERLIEHCPRNIHVHQRLAEAYARQNLFDKALACYRHALEIAGGWDPELQRAISDTTVKQIDAALAGLDPKSADYTARRDELQKKRRELQWTSDRPNG